MPLDVALPLVDHVPRVILISLVPPVPIIKPLLATQDASSLMSFGRLPG
jgi:hypothetical protein